MSTARAARIASAGSTAPRSPTSPELGAVDGPQLVLVQLKAKPGIGHPVIRSRPILAIRPALSVGYVGERLGEISALAGAESLPLTPLVLALKEELHGCKPNQALLLTAGGYRVASTNINGAARLHAGPVAIGLVEPVRPHRDFRRAPRDPSTQRRSTRWISTQ